MSRLNQKKTPGFGIGKKASQQEISQAEKEKPPPGHYTIASNFETNKMHSKGYSFGISKEAYEKVQHMGPLGKQQENERKGWTEPGLYTLAGFADIVKSGKKKIFFGERCYDNPRDRQASNSLEKKKRYTSNEPGPGQYDDDKYEGLNKYGNYSNSKHQNSLAQNFSQGKRKTFMEVKSMTPGPGTYDDGLNISRERNPVTDAQYVNSDYKNVLSTNFGKYAERFDHTDDYTNGPNKPNMSSIRKKQNRESRNTPGPGQYELVSDFGRYD